MAELPLDRIPNWPRSDIAVCGVCQDDGMIIVTLRKPEPSYAPTNHPGRMTLVEPSKTSMYEEQGPCPHCAIGFRIEFGIGVKKNTRDEIIEAWYENARGGPWGRDGYWRGRTLLPGM